MSRIGKKSVVLPKEVTASVEEKILKIKGPKGSLELKLHPHIEVEIANVEGVGELVFNVLNQEKADDRALWGLFRNLACNMVLGVTEGFSKQLEVNGIGFRVALQGRTLVLEVGFSHPVNFDLPQGIEARVEKNIITVSGIDKQLVGETAARIRSIKKPEPYKGKGIKYTIETIRRKAGKAVKTGGA